MSLSLSETVIFSDSIDSPKKLVPITKVQMGTLSIGQTPAGINANIDDSKNQLVFTPNFQGPSLQEPIIVNFGAGSAAETARDAAFAAVVAACEAV